MSTASRQPYTSSVPASWPVLVDRGTGRIDRQAIRGELKSRWHSPARWTVARVLAATFQKVRLQRRWVLADIEENKLISARVEQERGALEAKAQEVAKLSGFNTGRLRFQCARYQFGSLADTRDAPEMRALYARAIVIATEHYGAQLQAAE